MVKSVGKRLTMAQIAHAAGVSVPTVSKVLNQRYDGSYETREHVERVMTELGYFTEGTAHNARRAKTCQVNLVMPYLNSAYELEIIRGVEKCLETTDCQLVLTTAFKDSQLERRWLNHMINGAIDGVILTLADKRSAHLDLLQRHHVPFVIIDHLSELGPNMPSVGVNNFAGGRLATKHLLSLGHRHIATIIGPTHIICAQDRLAGYRAALEEAHCPISPDYVRRGEFTEVAGAITGYEETLALLELPTPPTAIFASNDVLAMGVYRALRERGLTVPQDMSVVGYDDVPIAEQAVPALTTVHQPLFEMGRMAATMLQRLMDHETLDSTRVELPTALVIRASCSAPTT